MRFFANVVSFIMGAATASFCAGLYIRNSDMIAVSAIFLVISTAVRLITNSEGGQ